MKLKNQNLQHLGFIALAFAGLAADSAQAASNSWGANAAGNWATAGSWTGGVNIPGATSGTTSTDIATFGFTLATSNKAVTVDTDRNIGGITFTGNNSNLAYQLSGGNLLLTNAGVIQVDSGATSGTHTDSIASAIAIQGDGGTAAFTSNGANSRGLSFGGGVTGVSTGSNVTTLTLNGSSTTGNNFITGVIADGAGGGKLAVVKDGAGAWSLHGAGTYSGGFTLNGGTIVLQRDSAGAVGSVTSGALGTGTVTLNGGSVLASSQNNVGNQKNVFNSINVASGTTILGANTTLAVLRLMGAITGSGTLSNPTTGTTATSAMFGGDLSGFTGTFDYQNTNSLTNFRFGNNTGAAATPLTGQTIDASQAKFVVNASGAITRNVALNDNIGGSTLKMGSLSGNGVVMGSFNNNGTDVQAANTYEIGALGLNDVFTGLLSNSTTSNQADFNVVKTGTGSLTLSGTSFYTGTTTVQNGSLIAGAAVASATNGAFGNSATAIALGDATSISSNLSPSLLTGGAFTVARNITVGSSNTATTGVYTIGGNTANTSTFSGITTLNQSLKVTQVASGTLNLTGNITSGASGTQTLTFNNVGSVSQSTGVIGGGTGTIAVTQSGAGTTTLSGANTYSGATTISSGILNAATLANGGSNSAIGASTNVAANLVLDGGTLQYTGTTAASTDRNYTLGTSGGSFDASGATLGTMTISGNMTASGSSGSHTLTLTGTGTGATGGGTLSGTISNGTSSNTTALTKTGAGTWTLTGANAYTGDTTVNAGVLAVNGNAIANANKLVINGGKVASTGTEVVNTLFFGATQQASGTWGATGSGATHIDDVHFSGTTGVVSVTTAPVAGYTTWANANGATGQTVDQDHDNDGVDNGIEYFMGATGTSFTPTPALVGGSTGTVTWPMGNSYANSANYGTSYLVQTSPDLVTWTQAPQGSGPNTVTVTAGVSVVYTMPSSGTKLFVRLVVNN